MKIVDIFFGTDQPGYGRTLDGLDYFTLVVALWLCWMIPWVWVVFVPLLPLYVLVAISKHGDRW